jgi:hypothetical protein
MSSPETNGDVVDNHVGLEGAVDADPPADTAPGAGAEGDASMGNEEDGATGERVVVSLETAHIR